MILLFGVVLTVEIFFIFSWLERTPFLSSVDFEWWPAYRQGAVNFVLYSDLSCVNLCCSMFVQTLTSTSLCCALLRHVAVEADLKRQRDEIDGNPFFSAADRDAMLKSHDVCLFVCLFVCLLLSSS